MGDPRLQRTSSDSFYGDYLYEHIVPEGHFLRQLRDLVPWQRFTYRLLKYYRGKGQVGRPPIDPAILLKMLLLSYLYELSERQVEEFCDYFLPAKYFIGLAIDGKAPDHSTLTLFKKRILENGKLRAYERMLGQIVSIAQEAGIAFGPIQLVDSTHSIADVDLAKERHRDDDDRGPRDPGARWGCKGVYTFHDAEGQTHRQRKYFYGYKLHASFNVGAQMITGVKVSSGNHHDGAYLCPLIQGDLAQGLPLTTCVADRGYDDTAIHFQLQQWGIRNAIHLVRARTKKKDANKKVWQRLKAEPWYQAALQTRYQIERKFGEAKLHHGLRRCRYLTLERYGIQAYLTAMALNLKQLVSKLSGVSLRGPTPIRA
jgi:IS5 family transposase